MMISRRAGKATVRATLDELELGKMLSFADNVEINPAKGISERVITIRMCVTEDKRVPDFSARLLVPDGMKYL